MGTAIWTAEAVEGIGQQRNWALPVIDAPQGPARDQDIWDMWHIAYADGRMALPGGASWWFFLATPRFADPEDRHDAARIRLFSHDADGWHDHGPAFPDGLTPGSREWSGSAVLGEDDRTLTMYFTATGRQNGPHSFEQRLFHTTGVFDWQERRCTAWSVPEEIVAADGHHYAVADQVEAPVWGIKGFRDPGFFHNPADGRDYIFFTASAPQGAGRLDGLIGAAVRGAAGWELLPPVVDAMGVNSELERPHIILHDGLYYLFWCTHGRRFAPGLGAPSGLYAMVANRIAGPWRPVNGTGLVAGNPSESPFQTYCWWVTHEGDVISFVDYPGRADPQAQEPQQRRARFGGVPAPFFALDFQGDTIAIRPSATVNREQAHARD
jgi:levansucrase